MVPYGYGRPSLALDLMEEFRPLVKVDKAHLQSLSGCNYIRLQLY
jgi:hypothetical protein